MRAALFVVLIGGLAALGEATLSAGDDEAFPPSATIRAPAVRECSGIVASRRQPGIFWTHNDSGGAPEIYAIRATGELVASVAIHEGMNRDWEDIAADDAGFLYVGDLGDNLGKRPLHMVYKIREPDVAAAPASVEIVERMLFRFPDEKYDCESLFAYCGELYALTKQLFRSPTLFRLEPMAADGFDNDGARWRPYDRAMRAVAVCKLPIRMATGADVSADDAKLAVCSYGQTWVFDLPDDRDLSKLAGVRPRRIAYPGKHQIEAVTFDGEDLILAAESRGMWRVTAEDVRAERQWWGK